MNLMGSEQRKLPFLICFVDCLLEVDTLVVELATDVDVCGAGVHCVTSNQTTLDQGMRVLTNNLTVLSIVQTLISDLACSRLGLITVDH